MYEHNETPAFNYTLFYLDYNYAYDTAIRIQEILQKNGFFPPPYIRAGKRTHNRLLKYHSDMKCYLAEAYEKKNL